MRTIIALDPGTRKCGLLIAERNLGCVLDGRVVDKCAVKELIDFWLNRTNVEDILIGNGTSSTSWQKELENIKPLRIVDERGTTLRARKRYWDLWPPRDWLRLFPRGLISPPDDLDAVAALIMLEDYLKQKLQWE